MFSPNTPLYMTSICAGLETVDEETRKILLVDFQAQPFTREMADDLGLGAELFEGSSGNPNDLLAAGTFRISVPLQRLSFKMAPDAEGGRVVIEDVEVGKTIKVRADKEGPVLSATISCTMRYPTPDNLLYLLSGYREQHWLTFENQQRALPMGDGDSTPRRGRKKKEQPDGEAVETTAGASA